jgi:hypothetical protein
MITQILEYRLQVNGIFGRNRKPKFETFLILETDASEPMDMEKLKALAGEKIAEIKVKSGRVCVTKTPVTIEQHDGHTFKSMMLSLAVNNTCLDLGTI